MNKKTVSTLYTNTGSLLKAVRLREGLNQKDFATLIHVTKEIYLKWSVENDPWVKFL